MSFIAKILLDIVLSILLKLPDWVLEWGVGKILDGLIEKRMASHPPEDVQLYSSTCGDIGIDLAQQRLLVSTAFGAYFTGLLEREHNYASLKGQIECSAMRYQEALEPIQRIFWALHCPKGPRSFIIAAEGGMGKSTLAAKIVRCLFEEQAIDMILGDSAKAQYVDPTAGKIVQMEPGYYDLATFYERVCGQLGLPPSSDEQDMVAIRDRLEGRKAVIVVDNLETVAKRDKLLRSLQSITTRDVRAIVTTREVKDLRNLTPNTMVVRLNPITDLTVVREFLEWHIRQHQNEHPGLNALEQDLDNKKCVRWLIERTGGIPLLIQLVFSDVARFSWDYLGELPNLYGDELLAFLYQSRWDELGSLGTEGLAARELLKFVTGEQYRGKKVTLSRLKQWAQETERYSSFASSLSLLHERFLIVNHDPRHGNFAVFPSLSEFLQRHH
ncbi:MAG: AAA family ATPase [Chloroflexota bacterium]|nr:AAA family ATPase [Chloroflexota bacterium]